MDYDYTIASIEKMLVKLTLTDKKYLSVMADVFDKRWFENSKEYTSIVSIATWYFKKENKIPKSSDMKLFIERYCEKHTEVKIEDLNAVLMDIHNFNVPEDEEMVRNNIEHYIKEKGYYFSICDNIETITKKGDITKCLDRFDKINKIMLKDDNLGLNYFSTEGQETHWDVIKNPDAKISTGWDGLDTYTNGGFLKDGRMLALFVGQPGLGKSIFLANIAVNFLKQNKSVVVISLEMSEHVYCSRFDSIISEDNINKLCQTAETSQKKINEFYQKHSEANLIVKEYPPSSVRVVDIERYLDKLKENGVKIEAIVIDYLNLLLSNTKEDSMYMTIKKVAEQLRALSYKFNAPVISATQANREGTNNEKIDLVNISESTGQSQTADWIGMLFRSEEDRQSGVINMRIAKNRFGSPGKVVRFMLNPKNLSLKDMTFTGASNITNSEADEITSNLSEIENEVMDI